MTPKASKGSEAVSKNIKQVVDKVNSSTNILVTVSRDPSVDELSAALGLTALLDKLDKHGTAIFSGATPPAIQFLNPDAVFEDSADSLRDFIVAINKDKADHLRYKVDGDIVKIFITPYRSQITEADLEFSQGDYNVELVFAIGAENQEDLDKALAAHGRILHDATVVGVGCGDNRSGVGSIEWHSDSASSFSEMIADLADLLSSEDKPVIDEQVATALLTGIVAATDRFSNLKTTSHVMTLAAQLMAKGADQQLIAARLQESHEITDKPAEAQESSSDTSDEPKPLEASPDGEVNIDLGSSTLPPEEMKIPKNKPTAKVEPADNVEYSQPEEQLTPPAGATVASAYAVEDEAVQGSKGSQPGEEPQSNGPSGTTPTGQAEQPVVNKRSYVGDATPPQPANDPKSSIARPQEKVIAPLSSVDRVIQPLGASGESQATDARAAIEAALSETAPQQVQPPQSEQPIIPPPQPPAPPAPGLPMPPPLPDFSTLPPPPPPPMVPGVGQPAPSAQPERLGDIFAPEANQAPAMPGQPQSVPPPQQMAPPASPPPLAPPVAPPQAANDPSQFQIPGQ